ncbi:MAG: MFS transporter [Pedosphaera sp.]|nr:MFS transporter [Pedosphaera sp.]
MSDTSNKQLPSGLNNFFWFGFFNALSFQIILSSPMLLYAKSLDASATVLGLLSGMMPLLVIFQIPAAKHLGRISYKRFLLLGWGTRVLFIFLIALVPLAGFLKDPTRLVLVLALLFAFNLTRGIASCAWLPWVAAVVPEDSRGTYLVRDALFVNTASLLTFWLSALMLGNKPANWQFAALFGFSAVAGVVSLLFMRRIPEAPMSAEVKQSSEPVPWGAIAGFKPFRRLLVLGVVFALATGGLGTFILSWLRSDPVNMAENRVLLVISAQFLGGMSTLWLLGERLDRYGSRPVIALGILLGLGLVDCWVLLAGGVLQPTAATIAALQFAMGFVGSIVGMGITRLLMAVVPTMGKNHFFAMYSVATSLTAGLSPILWGILIDGLAEVRMRWLGLEWNSYSLFFAASAMLMLVTLWLCSRLVEQKAERLEALMRDLFIEGPLRIWPRG